MAYPTWRDAVELESILRTDELRRRGVIKGLMVFTLALLAAWPLNGTFEKLIGGEPSKKMN